MTGEWNADSYHRVSNPHVNWGVAVLEQLPLAGDEVVVDLGCGTRRQGDAADDPPFELDYWRLNMRARKPGGC